VQGAPVMVMEGLRALPLVDRICEAARCCRRTVAASLAALEAAGLLGVANHALITTQICGVVGETHER
jgi:hypothetical protein